MRSWVEVATRHVMTNVSVTYRRTRVHHGEDGPDLGWEDLNPDTSTIAMPSGFGEPNLDQKRELASFVNVMLSLTVDETALIAGLVQSRADFAGDNHRRADEAKLLPLAKELTSALEKARAQEAQLADAKAAS